MAWFEFEAKDRTGAIHKDRIEASDQRHAYHLLTAKHWFVIKMNDAAGKEMAVTASKEKESLLQRKVARARISAKARRKHIPEKVEQLVQLLRAGMRLSEVLAVMSRRTSDPAWRGVFEDLRSGVVGGKPLSEAMAARPELFGTLFRAMVAAGEASGHLVEVLEKLGQYLQKREVVQQRVVSALIYPCIVVAAGLGTVVFFMLFMLPRLEGMFKSMGKALPWSTQLLISISHGCTKFGWMVPVLALVVWVVFRSWLKDPENRLIKDRFVLRIPVIGKLLGLNEYSRFTQTLATLLQSGITLVEALQVSEATLGNTALKTAIRETRSQVRDGKSLNEALAGQKLFPGLMIDMLAVGERTGDLAGALKHTAEAYERDLDRSILNFTALIEPVLILVMAVFVGSIVFSVLMAVLEMTTGIQSQSN
jgi:type II secretory pathway component PulF